MNTLEFFFSGFITAERKLVDRSYFICFFSLYLFASYTWSLSLFTSYTCSLSYTLSFFFWEVLPFSSWSFYFNCSGGTYFLFSDEFTVEIPSSPSRSSIYVLCAFFFCSLLSVLTYSFDPEYTSLFWLLSRADTANFWKSISYISSLLFWCFF